MIIFPKATPVTAVGNRRDMRGSGAAAQDEARPYSASSNFLI
jgi:hypothetical protein